jgi:hypothetical protein
MRRLRTVTMLLGATALLAVSGCGGELSTPQEDGDAELLPPDPEGLTYEAEPDPWAGAPDTLLEGEPPGVYGIDSCRLHNGFANGNHTRLTPYQVAVLAHNHGVACGANLVRAVAITGAESSRYQYAYLVNTNCSIDRGLWQINSGYWPSYSSYAQATNAHGMYVISSHGTNWHPWVTYNNGAYKSYWSNACAAVKALCGASHAGC